MNRPRFTIALVVVTALATDFVSRPAAEPTMGAGTGHSMTAENSVEIEPGPEGPVDHPCIDDPTFPSNCVQELGPIGGPVTIPAHEGFLNIASPVVDPVLTLRSANTSDGLVYAVDPLGSRVRVFDPSASLAVVKDIRVCYRPSALASREDGGEIYVGCHASGAIGVIDTATNDLTAFIQSRDAEGRPRIQEPMGMVAAAGRLYVTSSQNNRIAVVDTETRSVLRMIPVPGQDPRDIAISPAGGHLVVANMLAGNRTEPSLPFNAAIFSTGNPAGDVCAPILLSDPTAINVIDENHPDFMNTSHPEYPVLAECYLFAHTFGQPSEVVINPARPDHDLVVIDRVMEEVVFSTDVLPEQIGTLNYNVAFAPSGTRLFLTTVHARNDLDEAFGDRPLINRLAILELDETTGSLSVHAIRDLDAPFLNGSAAARSMAATPYGLAVTEDRVLITAAGSDRLIVTDHEGALLTQAGVGFTPKGVSVEADAAQVYNATGFSVTAIDLLTMEEVAEGSLGDNALPQTARIGAHLFNSARFASNGTFACASCHPDGHLDGLLWKLNLQDGLRSTMTIQEISETAPYHWDGSKCNLVKILQDGIVNLFGDPDGPTECEMKTMIDFMQGLVRPHSPYRAPDGKMTEEADLGLGILHRGRFRTTSETPASCNGVIADPAVEARYLAAIGDPFKTTFNFNGGGGPFPNTLVAETCSTAGCHMSPHWGSLGKVAGIEAVSVLGVWDRNVTTHSAFTTRAKAIEALEINRAFHGGSVLDAHENMTGELATHAFTDSFFRHTEFNHDPDPATNAYPLAEALTQFMMEEEQLQSGAVGLSTMLTRESIQDVDSLLIRNLLLEAAGQGKIALLGEGTLSGSAVSLHWSADASVFVDENGGTTYTMAELIAAMSTGDRIALFGVLPQGQTPLGPPRGPKVRNVTRSTSPYLCTENPPDYHANARMGETDVALMIQGVDIAPGSRVLIDGVPVGAPLTGPGPAFPWILPAAPSTPTVLALQVLGPSGMQSNSIALPVVSPVVPAFEPDDLIMTKAGPSWGNQFGITGPGTRYDVFKGLLSTLRSSGLSAGACLAAALVQPQAPDATVPALGDGFYYLARAQNQTGVTTWGSPERDSGIAASGNGCPAMF